MTLVFLVFVIQKQDYDYKSRAFLDCCNQFGPVTIGSSIDFRMDCKKFVLSLAVLLAADHVAALQPVGVVGGDVVPISKAPYSASIQINGQHNCGGAFIASRFVLTAAHCVLEDKYNISGKYHYTVVSNRSNVLTDKEVGQQAGVKRIYIHDRYNYTTPPNFNVEHDIAVFVLDSDISEHILGLPEKNESFIGKNTSIAGWGMYFPFTDIDGKLRYLDMEVLDKESKPECPKSKTPTICARGKTNASDDFKGICRGDSGGVLQSENKAVGIVSHGTGFCLDIIQPTTFTEVASYLPFINGILKGKPVDANIIDL